MDFRTLLFLHERKQQHLQLFANNQLHPQLTLLRICNWHDHILQFTHRYSQFLLNLTHFLNFPLVDPFELQNRIDQLKPEERSYLHGQLKELMACKGRSCTMGGSFTHPVTRSKPNLLPVHSILPQPQRFKKKKILDDLANGK